MNKNDIDELVLYVKKDKCDNIINCYVAFGWSLKSKQENQRYEDLMDLHFTREHYLPQKDELQLTQVYLEEKLNKLAFKEKHKHSKTISLGLVMIPVSITLLFLTILWLIHFQTVRSIILGGIMGIIGISLLIITIILLPRLYKKENQQFSSTYTILRKEIEDICNHAIALRGGNNE